jgi:hypothetical protein
MELVAAVALEVRVNQKMQQLVEVVGADLGYFL